MFKNVYDKHIAGEMDTWADSCRPSSYKYKYKYKYVIIIRFRSLAVL